MATITKEREAVETSEPRSGVAPTNLAPVERALVAIIAEAIDSPVLSALTPATVLAALEFDRAEFLRGLGIDATSGPYRNARSIRELAACLCDAGPETLAALREQAAVARLRRLLWATLSVTPDLNPVARAERWWTELASQVLWWHASELCAAGRQLVEADGPVRATTVLSHLGLLSMQRLSAPEEKDLADLRNALVRIGYDAAAADSAASTLTAVARTIASRFGGRLQRALTPHAEALVEALCRDLLPAAIDRDANRNAVRSWISMLTSLPINILSPSALQLVDKFARFGVTEASFSAAAEDKQIDFVAIDRATCSFMDGTCRHCDPDDPQHRYCAKKLAPIGWEVECVAADWR
jgi:hypothetical protein